MTSIHSYFSPVCSNLYSDKDQWEVTQIGRSVDTHLEGSFPDIKYAEIVFFNISEYEGTKNFTSSSDCKVRAAFYDLHFENLPRISDLGSLLLMADRRESFKIVQLVCEKLLHDGIIPIIIGGGHDLSYAVYKAYSKLERYITLTSVDSKFDIGLKNDNLDWWKEPNLDNFMILFGSLNLTSIFKYLYKNYTNCFQESHQSHFLKILLFLILSPN